MPNYRLSRTTAQTVIVALFIAVLLTSNIASTKLFGIWGTNIIIDGGTILFPLAYILGDVITEVYGFRKAKLVILCGLMSMLLMSLTLYAVQLLPPAAGWGGQESYETILGVVPRIVIGSLVAYLVGEILNSYILAKMKTKAQGKHLWMRLLGSTAAGALADTVIFSLIAFYGIIPLNSLIALILSVYVIKLIVEIVALPLTYRVVRRLKKIEGSDHFDTKLSVKTALKG